MLWRRSPRQRLAHPQDPDPSHHPAIGLRPVMGPPTQDRDGGSFERVADRTSAKLDIDERTFFAWRFMPSANAEHLTLTTQAN